MPNAIHDVGSFLFFSAIRYVRPFLEKGSFDFEERLVNATNLNNFVHIKTLEANIGHCSPANFS